MPESPLHMFKEHQQKKEVKKASKKARQRSIEREQERNPYATDPWPSLSRSRKGSGSTIESGSDTEGTSPLQYKKPGASRSQQELHPSSPPCARPRQGSDSTQGSGSFTSSSPDLSRRLSTTLPTIPERAVTPSSGPVYIHREHGRRGTNFKLKDHSPLGGTPNVMPLRASPEVVTNRNSGLSAAGVVQKDFARTIPGPASSGEAGPPPQSKSHKRSKGKAPAGDDDVFTCPKTGTTGTASTGKHQYTVQVPAPTPYQRAQRPAGIAHGPCSFQETELISQTSGDIPIGPPSDTEDEEPTRPSFEPESFTADELHAYRNLRLAYSLAMIFERAGGVLTSLYKDADWPADIPPILSSANHSSIMWAREAAKAFREEAKDHPVYKKFQLNGNDIAFRARNDLNETGGDMSELKERVDDWQTIDKAEGVVEMQLERGSVNKVGLERPGETARKLFGNGDVEEKARSAPKEDSRNEDDFDRLLN